MNSITPQAVRADLAAVGLLPTRGRFVLYGDDDKPCAVCPMFGRALARSAPLREEFAAAPRQLAARIDADRLALLAGLPTNYVFGFICGVDRPGDPVPVLFAGNVDYALGHADARAKGYTGDPCPKCGAMTCRPSGACLICDTCNESSGCS